MGTAVGLGVGTAVGVAVALAVGVGVVVGPAAAQEATRRAKGKVAINRWRLFRVLGCNSLASTPSLVVGVVTTDTS